MPWLPDAVEGALIAAGVSLTGLLITNQSKVSGFRQDWINALRDDAALLVTKVIEIHTSIHSATDQSDESFNLIHETTFRIRLRLNPKEPATKEMLAALVKLKGATSAVSDFGEFNEYIEQFLSATQTVLKKEWKRVKTGEMFYRWTFRLVAGAFLTLLPIAIYRNYHALLHFIFGNL